MSEINHYAKYEYQELDYEGTCERSCYTPGRVYRFNHEHGSKRGLMDGDLLLCIMKSGDCHADFVRITHRETTSYTGIPTYQLFAYFDVHDKHSEYGGMEDAFPRMETLSPVDLIHVLLKKQVLIPFRATLSDDELADHEKEIELASEMVALTRKKMGLT